MVIGVNSLVKQDIGYMNEVHKSSFAIKMDFGRRHFICLLLREENRPDLLRPDAFVRKFFYLCNNLTNKID